MTTDTHRKQIADACWRQFAARREGPCVECSRKDYGHTSDSRGNLCGAVWCAVPTLAQCPAAQAWEARA